jgi:cation/acetate symporter
VDGLWWGVAPVSAGVFGVPMGLFAGVLMSKIWPPSRSSQSLARLDA